MQEIQAQGWAYGMSYLINRYFDCIKMPEEGDLVIYPNAAGSPHTGIYRKSKPNWNSPYGGTVESKWGGGSPFVFQHDVFFTPDHYGDIAQFYRPKKQRDPVVSSKEGLLIPPSMSTIGNDAYFGFNEAEENMRIRKEIDPLSGRALVKQFPQIQLIEYIKFTGYCYDYAFGKIFNTYRPPHFMPIMPSHDWIENYFTVTTEPLKGDLVCYYKTSSYPVHYGIYDSPNLVESKWGAVRFTSIHPFTLQMNMGI